MKYDITGKKITSISESCNELNIRFDDGVRITIRGHVYVGLDSERKLTVNPGIEVTTDKIELKASEEIEAQAEEAKEEKPSV